MLTGNSYVFILGAGASKPYGFPLGDELYQFMCSSLMEQFRDEEVRKMAEEFSTELRQTFTVSIDKYLNINKSLKDIGILSIAAAIHFFESKSVLQGDWYTYLYKKMIEGLDTPEELLRIAENKVCFITFNYDRSLEHYLFSNLYGLLKNARVPKNEIAAKLTKIPIIHVYGRTGYLPWEKYADVTNPLIVPYAGFDSILPGEIAIQTQKMINLIYDERKNAPELEEAKELISNANNVFFLGFGYDEMNLSILGLPGSLQDKHVIGTAFGYTENEMDQVIGKLRSGVTIPRLELINRDCLTLLRERLT